jgi:hypothetical protein
MGYHSGITYVPITVAANYYHYPEFIMNDYSCSGGEANLFDCPKTGSGTNLLGNANDVGLDCTGTRQEPQGYTKIEGGECRGFTVSTLLTKISVYDTNGP